MLDLAEAVIIGGGINGLSVAYNLARLGLRKVRVLEKSYLASGATGRCGAGVRQQWGTEMNIRLARASIKKFEVMNDELGYYRDIEFKQKGYLMLAYTGKQLEQFQKNVVLQRSLGVPVSLITPAEARGIVPHLNTEGLLGATFCPEDGHVNPFHAAEAYALAAKRLGVEIHPFTEVQAILVEDGRVRGVLTAAGTVATPIVVNTAGGYSAEVSRMAGVEIPTYSERHQILVTEPVEPLQGPMVISFYHGIYCQQTPHGSFIMGQGDPNEPKGHDLGHSWQFLTEVARKVTWLLPPLKGLRLVRQWSGSYNMTPDAQPIIGEAAEVKGFFLAVGFSGHGFMLAPMTGQLLAEKILGRPTTLPIDMLGLERFARGELIREPSVV